MTDLAPLVDASVLTPTDSDRVKRAAARVREWCGWHIAPTAQTTAVFDVLDPVVALFLPTRHLVSIDVVTLADGTVLDASAFTSSESGILEIVSGRWPAGLGAVTVQMTHGYDAAPDSVVGVVAALATRMPIQAAGLVQKVAGPYTSIFGMPASPGWGAGGFTSAEEADLAPYRLTLAP